MELVINLQEDPNLQRLKTNIHELQQQYNEVQATAHSVAIAQNLPKLQEGKKILTQVEEAQKKRKSLRHDWILG